MEKAKTLGILGGLGPMAGVYFYEKVTALTKASCDQEHINVILAGLAAGHVQLQPLCLQICKSGLQCCVFRPPLVQCHVFVCSHLSHPLRVIPEILSGAAAPNQYPLYYTHFLTRIQAFFLMGITKIRGKGR